MYHDALVARLIQALFGSIFFLFSGGFCYTPGQTWRVRRVPSPLSENFIHVAAGLEALLLVLSQRNRLQMIDAVNVLSSVDEPDRLPGILGSCGP